MRGPRESMIELINTRKNTNPQGFLYSYREKVRPLIEPTRLQLYSQTVYRNFPCVFDDALVLLPMGNCPQR